MVAIEALVVEVNEDKTRDLGLHYGFRADDLSKVIQGADVVLGRRLAPVAVPILPETVPEPDAAEINETPLGAAALGLTSVGFIPRLPGLGINLAGMDVNGGVVSARLRALLDQGEARITTRPIALALHNTTTLMTIGSEIPYQDIKTDGNREKLDVAFRSVGVKLAVRPQILDIAQQLVELDITQVEVSSLSNFITSRNVDRPVFNTSDTRTKVTLRAGETYQLSSLKSRRSRVIREGIPYLMNLPFLGHLFSSREEIEQGVDVLFFITPHIVPPGRNVLLPYDFEHGRDLIEQKVRLP